GVSSGTFFLARYHNTTTEPELIQIVRRDARPGFSIRSGRALPVLEYEANSPVTERLRFVHIYKDYGTIGWDEKWFAPCWALAVPLGDAASIAGVVFWKRRRRAKRRACGLCQECGYDMRASADRCPECGAAVR